MIVKKKRANTKVRKVKDSKRDNDSSPEESNMRVNEKSVSRKAKSVKKGSNVQYKKKMWKLL